MINLLFHGHSCFEVRSQNSRIIIDPWLKENPLATISPDNIQVNYILVTHGHFDHLGDAIEISKNTGAIIIGTAELTNYCDSKGCKTHRMHIGGSYIFNNLWVKLTQAWHGSSNLSENNFNLGVAFGFLFKIENKFFYHAGDTGLFSDMKFVIGDRYNIDVALLPIGDNVVMGIDDAVTATEWIKPKLVIPMHYNTFPVIKQDPEEFRIKVSKLSINCVIMQAGEVLNL